MLTDSLTPNLWLANHHRQVQLHVLNCLFYSYYISPLVNYIEYNLFLFLLQKEV